MKFLSKILAVFLAVMIFITANGFVYEYYFCQCCHENHQEIAFFEFGEISHDHSCHSHNHTHDHSNTCNHYTENGKNYHLEHTHVFYLSLKELFFNNTHIQVPDIQQITIFVDNCFTNTTELFTTVIRQITNNIFFNAKLVLQGKVCLFISCFLL